MGPTFIGMLSDALAPQYAEDSLRWAMFYVLPAIMAWSTLHFFFAARHLPGDLEAANG